MKKNNKIINQPSQKEMSEIEKLYKSNNLDDLEAKTRNLINNYPSFALLFNILGIALYKKKNFDEAIFNFNKAIKINDKFYLAYNNLGNCFKVTKKFQESEFNYKKAIQINPEYAEAYSNLGMVLAETGKIQEAIINQKNAINIKPNFAEAYNNLGILFARLGKYKESITNLKKALEIEPNYAEVYSNLGASMAELGNYDEALINYKKTLKLNPKYTEANFNESVIRLIKGEFDIGWKKYEFRFDKNFITKMRYNPEKIWDGKYLDGTLLVWAEQGVGDHILFASMIYDLKKYAKNIILEIDERLVNLFDRFCKKEKFFNLKVIKLDKTLVNNFDKHIAIGSLGQFLRKSKNSFENTPKKYLIPSPTKENYIKKKYFSNHKFKIGVSWKTLNKSQQYRNVSLEKMLPILSKPNFEFINLQFGKSDEDIKLLKLNHGITIKTIDEIDNYNNIDDLAALISCLDLVITIQNSTAHLAGALGKETWIMLTKNARWHWLINERKSLWYPSAKMFKQEDMGDWNKVINNIKINLEKK